MAALTPTVRLNISLDTREQNHAISFGASPGSNGLALIPGAHEGYLSWEEFQRIECAIRDNTQGEQRPGAAKNGQALLSLWT